MFVAVDVETANADVGSICQIGIAKFDASGLIDEWSTLVDPEDYFDRVNIGIHGIDESAVRGAPKFPDLARALTSHLAGIVVSHTPFDRSAMNKAAQKYALPELSCTWLDSARIARRVWTQFAQRGYGLSNIASFIGYEYQAHDALEDAKAAGHVVLAAMRESGLALEELLKRASAPLGGGSAGHPERVSLDGNPDGLLYGECLVFTGQLQMTRREAAEVAAKLGCKVTPGVTKKTTMLVVGDQDTTVLAGHKKSSKHRRAEELIGQGQSIRILKESDFLEMCEIDNNRPVNT